MSKNSLIMFSVRNISVEICNTGDIYSFQDTESALPPEALKYCLSSCYYYLLWGLRDLEVAADNVALTHAIFQDLRDKLDEFIESSQNLIRSSPHTMIKEEAYVGKFYENVLITFTD